MYTSLKIMIITIIATALNGCGSPVESSLISAQVMRPMDVTFVDSKENRIGYKVDCNSIDPISKKVDLLMITINKYQVLRCRPEGLGLKIEENIVYEYDIAAFNGLCGEVDSVKKISSDIGIQGVAYDTFYLDPQVTNLNCQLTESDDRSLPKI